MTSRASCLTSHSMARLQGRHRICVHLACQHLKPLGLRSLRHHCSHWRGVDADATLARGRAQQSTPLRPIVPLLLYSELNKAWACTGADSRAVRAVGWPTARAACLTGPQRSRKGLVDVHVVQRQGAVVLVRPVRPVLVVRALSHGLHHCCAETCRTAQPCKALPDWPGTVRCSSPRPAQGPTGLQRVLQRKRSASGRSGRWGGWFPHCLHLTATDGAD